MQMTRRTMSHLLRTLPNNAEILMRFPEMLLLQIVEAEATVGELAHPSKIPQFARHLF